MRFSRKYYKKIKLSVTYRSRRNCLKLSESLGLFEVEVIPTMNYKHSAHQVTVELVCTMQFIYF